MLYFTNDYGEGACPEILRRLAETNFEHLAPYGDDIYSTRAKEKIRAECACPDAAIYFLVGGTQSNATVIASLLREGEGVISAATGHINAHEAGAVELTGHKVIALTQHLGKLDAGEVRAYMNTFYADETHIHMVAPKLVYISHPTEYGTLYTKAELAALVGVCREYGMKLYLDGARLGYGLASRDTDVTMADVAAYCDAFYIGGTKVGALCGEAVVFTRNAPENFFTTVKRHGALLAKGRLAGVQFDTLFTDGLYMKISRHAIDMAELLKAAFAEKGYKFLINSPTNQQFVVLENTRMKTLAEKVAFSVWEKTDDTHTVVRFAVSWATTAEDVAALRELL